MMTYKGRPIEDWTREQLICELLEIDAEHRWGVKRARADFVEVTPENIAYLTGSEKPPRPIKPLPKATDPWEQLPALIATINELVAAVNRLQEGK